MTFSENSKYRAALRAQGIDPDAPDAPVTQGIQGKYVKVKSGDTVSGLMGSSSPQAVGAFLAGNDMANSNLRVGQMVFVPDDVNAFGAQGRLGQSTLNSDNRRLALAAQASAATAQNAGSLVISPELAALGSGASFNDGLGGPSMASADSGRVPRMPRSLGEAFDNLKRGLDPRNDPLFKQLGTAYAGVAAAVVGYATNDQALVNTAIDGLRETMSPREGLTMAVSLGLTGRNAPGGSKYFDVITEAPISGTTRPAHRASANEYLADSLKADPVYAGRMNQELGADVLQHMQSGQGSALRNPPSTEWHHPITDPNSMWLLRTSVHRDPALQDYLHFGNSGGFAAYYGNN
jgi:hypothetical protein